ncbi:acyl carrier protein [Pendulispora albinea]|uniref:Acyl carrier protein n=1 Tax=Pendulispora albinea TaxID=2741071 RepID=A0ABZ2LZE5_9BACT
MSTADRVKEIIAEHLAVSADELALDASFVQDLGVDSLDLSELVIAFEQTFKIRISPEDARQIRTARSAIEYVESRTAASLRDSA